VSNKPTVRGISCSILVFLLAALLWPEAPAAAKLPATRAKPTASGATQSAPKKQRVRRLRFRVPTYAEPTLGDVTAYDDPLVREAAVEALGKLNGSVVALDPNTGRLLAVLNQKLAFSEGFQPCSTIKPIVALAGLSEGLIRRDTMVKVARRTYMNLTEAMAHSNNPYFELLGAQLGFEKVADYARQLGLGELAGYGIPEEHPGAFPMKPPANGGVARMSSFGEGIQVTPLQLAAMTAALANGGTLYYLQYPRSDEEQRHFAPRIKRRLSLETLLPELREGMLATVLYGTGRSSFDPEGEQPLGKTGTCSAQGSRLGWFASHSGALRPRVVIVVLLRGNTRIVNGGHAAQVAGRIYQRLRERGYFQERQQASVSAASGTAP